MTWLVIAGHRRTGDVPTRLGAAERDVARFADEDDASHGNRLDDARGRAIGTAP